MLEHIKAGGRLVIARRVVDVERVTKTQIVLADGRRLSRTTGRLRGDWRTAAYEATPERVEMCDIFDKARRVQAWHADIQHAFRRVASGFGPMTRERAEWLVTIAPQVEALAAAIKESAE